MSEPKLAKSKTFLLDPLGLVLDPLGKQATEEDISPVEAIKPTNEDI
jgi:hypothetical protein